MVSSRRQRFVLTPVLPRKRRSLALQSPFLTARGNPTAHATLICCAAPLGSVDESLTLIVRGPTSRSSARSWTECASEKEGRLPLLSLSQICQTSGEIGQADAWRAWIGPPQGASVGSDYRPLPSPIRDRRNLPQLPTAATELPCPSRPASWCVAYAGRSVADYIPRLRHRLEDGVANAEAPSSYEGPTRRISSYPRCSFASARIGMVSDPALAPKTNASSEYDLTGA